MSGFFDPVPIKPKTCARPRVLLPKTTRRGCFTAIYVASALLWGVLSMLMSFLILWIVVPRLVGFVVPTIWFWMISTMAFSLGSLLGISIGTRLNAQIITAGIELGEAHVVRDGRDGYNP